MKAVNCATNELKLANLYVTVTLGKWPVDRYIQGDRCTQVSFNPLTPVPPVTARVEPWPFFLF